jgi:hypothetical protein
MVMVVVVVVMVVVVMMCALPGPVPPAQWMTDGWIQPPRAGCRAPLSGPPLQLRSEPARLPRPHPLSRAMPARSRRSSGLSVNVSACLPACLPSAHTTTHGECWTLLRL